MNLREFLAVEVMGWKRWGDYWGNPDVIGSGEYTVYTWRPDELIEQAIMCGGKFDSWFLERHPSDVYSAGVGGEYAEGNTPAAALSLAVARAAGWKDE